MANELELIPQGLPVSVQFISANLATGAGTVDMIMDQGGDGLVVPTGYVFHPLYVCVHATGTLDADATVTAQVIDDGTELVNGPSATISQAASQTYATGVAGIGAAPCAAGSVVSVSLTKNADYDTTGTIDYDAILVGVLTPA